MAMRIVIYQHQKEPLFTNYLFSLTGNTSNTTSFRFYQLLGTFSHKSYKKKKLVYVLMRNFLLNIVLPQKLSISVAFTQVSKLVLHPQMLSSLAYIIKLFKITINKNENRLFDVCIFLLQVYSYPLISYKLVFQYTFDFPSKFSRLKLFYL